MPYSHMSIPALGVFALSIGVVLCTTTPTKEDVSITFEYPTVSQGAVIREANGLEFDGFVGVQEASIGQLIHYNGDKAAVPKPSGNEIQTFSSNPRYTSLEPKSVSVGCFLSRNLGGIIGDVPLSAIGLDDLQRALRGLAGAASTATSCTIRVRVTSMVSNSQLASLQAASHDYIDCKFEATGILAGVLGQGKGTVKACDLAGYGWAGTTALSFTLQSVDSPVDTGADSGTGATFPVIDDFKAVGTLKD